MEEEFGLPGKEKIMGYYFYVFLSMYVIYWVYLIWINKQIIKKLEYIFCQINQLQVATLSLYL